MDVPPPQLSSPPVPLCLLALFPSDSPAHTPSGSEEHVAFLNTEKMTQKEKKRNTKYKRDKDKSRIKFTVYALNECIDGLCAYGCACVYEYTVNTLSRCISSADFPAATQDQFFHPSCPTMDTAAPLPASLPNSTCLGACACTQETS